MGGVVTLVPEGLVLLTKRERALAVIPTGSAQVLVQQLPAVEMLARTDVICLDKTGTLTEPDSCVERVEPLFDSADWKDALASIGRADPRPNASIRAIAAAYAAQTGWRLELTVPFSSDRKWSAFQFTGRGWWVLGAPDVLVARAEQHHSLESHVARMTSEGERVLLLARTENAHAEHGLRGLEPAALVVLTEEIKPDAAQTLEQLIAQGVAVKLISGDHPSTVAKVASRVGLPSSTAIDGRDLPESESELAKLAESASVFGRVSPDQKRRLIRALQAGGHTVAMVGDGVNDVLALKEADLGIAMGGGSGAARAVAAVILIDGSFAGVPAVLAEGRRVIGNVERLASLFFTKTVYAFLLAVSVSVTVLPFPFLPRQLTLISAFTIGIPSVFLALAPSFERSPGGFLGRVLRFAVPSGLVAGAATFAAYALAINEPNLSLSEERTVATIVIATIGLWILARLARPLTTRRRALLVAMGAGLLARVSDPQPAHALRSRPTQADRRPRGHWRRCAGIPGPRSRRSSRGTLGEPGSAASRSWTANPADPPTQISGRARTRLLGTHEGLTDRSSVAVISGLTETGTLTENLMSVRRLEWGRIVDARCTQAWNAGG